VRVDTVGVTAGSGLTRVQKSSSFLFGSLPVDILDLGSYRNHLERQAGQPREYQRDVNRLLADDLLTALILSLNLSAFASMNALFLSYMTGTVKERTKAEKQCQVTGFYFLLDLHDLFRPSPNLVTINDSLSREADAFGRINDRNAQARRKSGAQTHLASTGRYRRKWWPLSTLGRERGERCRAWLYRGQQQVRNTTLRLRYSRQLSGAQFWTPASTTPVSKYSRSARCRHALCVPVSVSIFPYAVCQLQVLIVGMPSPSTSSLSILKSCVNDRTLLPFHCWTML
jgi:hypothetical protein